MLQRGRACEGAEIRSEPGVYVISVCSFNGAAPVRARKSDARCAVEVKGWTLQRGRACEGAEMKKSQAAVCMARNSFNGAAPVRARK